MSVAELGGRTVSYQYDNLYRLTSETIVAGVGDPGPSGFADYVLDAVGNRLSRSSNLQGLSNQTFTYNDNDLLDSDTYDANEDRGQVLIFNEDRGQVLIFNIDG